MPAHCTIVAPTADRFSDSPRSEEVLDGRRKLETIHFCAYCGRGGGFIVPGYDTG